MDRPHPVGLQTFVKHLLSVWVVLGPGDTHGHDTYPCNFTGGEVSGPSLPVVTAMCHTLACDGGLKPASNQRNRAADVPSRTLLPCWPYEASGRRRRVGRDPGWPLAKSPCVRNCTLLSPTRVSLGVTPTQSGLQRSPPPPPSLQPQETLGPGTQ